MADGRRHRARAYRGELTRRRFLVGTIGAAAATLPRSSNALAAIGCDPLTEPKRYRGVAPSPREVLGFRLGRRREVTSRESARYLDALAAASNRVVTGTYGSSVRGRPLRYAIVGRPEHVAPDGLREIARAAAEIRDPRTPAERVAALAATTPAIAWIIANVHGNEESGADAALRVLYDLSDREDCVVRRILDRTIVVVIPIQNPDGREADTRRNAYGFDLNRDLFARTQPETDAKLELMRRYPPMALVDSHEFGYYQPFFPPNNDPVYHEVTDQALHWINDIYGRAFSNAFKRRGWAFFHGKVYDFFSPEYNDTVTANGFQGAGMTIEVPNYKPLDLRFDRHYAIDMVALAETAAHKEELLRQQHRAFVRALEEGRAGELERNERVFSPRKPVKTEVAHRRVRHYFIRDEPAKRREIQRLVRRLQRMDVSVYRLTAPLAVSGYRPYAEASRPATVPAGTYWIPLAQPQKHWIQMLLNEDTYQPTLFTYGLSGWSNPLLMNLDGGTSGDDVAPAGALVPPVAEPPAPELPGRLPRIGLYQMSNGSFAEESAGSTRWLFETQWHLPYENLEAADVASGALRGLDVLVVPGGGSKPALRRLGGAGRRAILGWVNAGGRYVGYRGGGTRLAATIGLSTVLLSRAKADIPGSLVRARVDTDSPLAEGVGPYVWVLFADDFVMRASNGAAPVRFPTAESGDFFVSGFARREQNVEGTAAVVDEPVGDGRVVLFNADPTYQGSTEGMERILFNAVLGPDAPGSPGAAAGSPRRAGREAAARRAAAALPPWSGAIRLTVAREDRRLAAELLGRLGARFEEEVAGGAARFSIANPRELSLEEHPWALLLVTRLQRRGARIIAVSAG